MTKRTAELTASQIAFLADLSHAGGCMNLEFRHTSRGGPAGSWQLVGVTKRVLSRLEKVRAVAVIDGEIHLTPRGSRAIESGRIDVTPRRRRLSSV